MPAHDQTDPAVDPGAVPGPPSRVSRRSVLRGAAGAGAVGIAAASGAGAVLAAGRPATAATTGAAPAARLAGTGPLVVYLRDAASGEMEIFAGAGQARFRDPVLAARLLSRAQTDER